MTSINIEDYDYKLPRELIAQYPATKRTESRLMVVNRQTGTILHKKFADIVELLPSHGVLVLNETKVIPARLLCRKDTGGKVELLVVRKINTHTADVLMKPKRGMNKGRKLTISDVTAEVIDRQTVRFSVPVDDVIQSYGQIPLPPYIKRAPNEHDYERYQTVYARVPGSIAAPTAGLHFTKELLQKIEQKGIKIAKILLHVGIGTFTPIRTREVEKHRMHEEYFEISPSAANLINTYKPVIAVGTTTVRALESAAKKVANKWIVIPQKGYTDLFIYPGYNFKIVDMLVTNFHLPRTTLLLLVSAFAGRDLIMKAYNEAIKTRYRFYSYGDAMLIV